MRRERRSWRISALPLLLLLPPSSRVVVHSFPLVSAAAAAAAAVRESCGAMEADQPATRDLLEHALGWTSARGLGAGVKNSEGLWTTTHLPFALLPNSLPASSLEEVQALAPIFNELVDKISRDGEWLTTVLKDTAAGDDFTRELLKIHEEMQGKPQQQIALGIHRSDYMLNAAADGERPQMLQVELNTIASSFGCASSLTADLHRHLLARFGEEGQVGEALRAHLAINGLTNIGPAANASDLASRIPPNPTLTALPNALAAAHKASGVGPNGIVIFVVQPGEINSVDQRLLELGLWDNHHIPVRRMTLEEIASHCSLGDNGELIVDDGATVSVVYFRAGYTPDDYPTSKQWDARRLVEESIAVKCPNIGYHLAGTKKVQQVLTQPGQVERFLSSQDAAAVRKCFAGLWSVGEPNDADAAAAAAAAIASPENFVLKPQREGGGNNMYGEELVAKLTTAGEEELRSYVLMQLIKPQHQSSLLVNRGRVRSGFSLSEYGIYSTYLGRGGQDPPLVNEYAGFLVRTKLETVNEGGVASGYAVLSSPVLLD